MYEVKTYAAGSHAWLFRENDAFALPDPGGFAGVAALPDPEDVGWIPSGDIETWEDLIAANEKKEVRKPSPGGTLKRKAIIQVFQAMDFKLVTNDLTRIAVEAFYRTSTKLSDDVVQFVPLEIPPRNYWLKLQRYGQENQLIFAADLWVRMEVTGGIKGGNGELIMPEYLCNLLDSDLNTMAFGDLPEPE